jgi:hypothetical protein
MPKSQTYEATAVSGATPKRAYSSQAMTTSSSSSSSYTCDPNIFKLGPYIMNYTSCGEDNPFVVYWNRERTQACCLRGKTPFTCPSCIWQYKP